MILPTPFIQTEDCSPCKDIGSRQFAKKVACSSEIIKVSIHLDKFGFKMYIGSKTIEDNLLMDLFPLFKCSCSATKLEEMVQMGRRKDFHTDFLEEKNFI